MKVAIVLCLTLALLFPATVWAGDLTCRLSKKEIEVGLDPTRETVTVFGQAPENVPVIIKVEGPDRPVLVTLYENDSFIKFNEAEVQGLPGFYQVLTSVPTDRIKEKHWQGLGIDPEYRQLVFGAWVRMRQDIVEAYRKNQQDYINLALKMKDEKHLFSIRQGVVKRDGRNYRAEIPLVAGMPLGQIKVTAMALENEKLLSSEVQILHLKPSSILTLGSQELSVSAVMVISLFMVPILLLTVAQVLEIIEYRREQERRARLLREICQR
ncbi:MAG: TIGR02186 family protein [Firmicutes bacterium]|nr:TIGR02186 family protein [Bacillota bacterium]